jgi:hypothetical protein
VIVIHEIVGFYLILPISIVYWANKNTMHGVLSDFFHSYQQKHPSQPAPFSPSPYPHPEV